VFSFFLGFVSLYLLQTYLNFSIMQFCLINICFCPARTCIVFTAARIGVHDYEGGDANQQQKSE